MTKLAGKGAMLSVALSPRAARPPQPLGERRGLAAINGPASVVVSGDPEALTRSWAPASRTACAPAHRGRLRRPLRPDRRLRRAAGGLRPDLPRCGEIPFHSTLTGERSTPPARSRVLVPQPARDGAPRAGSALLLERGSAPSSRSAPTRSSAPRKRSRPRCPTRGGGPARHPAPRRGRGRALRPLAGRGPRPGRPGRWEALFAGSGARTPAAHLPLPARALLAHRRRRGGGCAAASPPDHPLLGAAIEDPAERLTLTGRISLETHPWLADHAVAGTVLLPAPPSSSWPCGPPSCVGARSVAELTLQAPLVLSEGGAQRSRSPSPPPTRTAAARSRSTPAPGEGAEGPKRTGLSPSSPLSTPEPLGEWPPAGAEPRRGRSLLRAPRRGGFEYGPAFQGLSAAWRDGERIYAEVSLAEEPAQSAERFGIHPALLDAALHGSCWQRERAPEPSSCPSPGGGWPWPAGVRRAAGESPRGASTRSR